jgi:hypothetical protein
MQRLGDSWPPTGGTLFPFNVLFLSLLTLLSAPQTASGFSRKSSP